MLLYKLPYHGAPFSSKNYDTALSVLEDNTTAGDYSGRIAEIEDKKALYDTYKLALSYFESRNNNKDLRC